MNYENKTLAELGVLRKDLVTSSQDLTSEQFEELRVIDYWITQRSQNTASQVLAPVTVESLRADLISASKEEASRRIQTINGRYYSNSEWLIKSQNLQDVRSNFIAKTALNQTISQEESDAYDSATDILNRKDALVAKQRAIESQLLAASTLEGLKEVILYQDSAWEL